jgi:hypothetical protein
LTGWTRKRHIARTEKFIYIITLDTVRRFNVCVRWNNGINEKYKKLE